ncbi:hypothetical protein HN51_034811 [Arachis hypogaea]|uniref:Uncharacterized protein n=1 Tax=Arachis hypogaea TaxID=3818 RepID=A0A445A747_ARAHY|nr:uncharacterized protein LOC112737268 [Arachis hypogaea]QHN99679.1 uncharacterized protein DS421_13g399920 [Arachis hypogaea]RYR22273.1 hypothetical protein Ahy_B03g067561 isoform A [Arachis hypogaea]
MALTASFAPFSIPGGHVKASQELCLTKRNCSGLGSGPELGPGPKLTAQRRSHSAVSRNRRSSICAEYREGGGGGVDFLAGFLMGGAILGTAAYIFAPQIRRSLLNENEYGFRKAKRPVYYDGRLERTRQTLNRKITQLNDAIDNVSSRLRRGNNNVPAAKMASDPEVEANM